MSRIAPAALAFGFLLPMAAHAQDEETIVTQCQIFNTTDYNADRSCFDTPPRPKADTLVPLTAEIQGSPSPTTLAIEVNADGSVVTILVVRPSGDPAFTRAAIVFVQNIEYNPALRDGRAVVGWTEQVFVPGPRQ